MVQVHWLCMCKYYYRRVMQIDCTTLPVVSIGVIKSWDQAIHDIHTFAKNHTIPTLVLNAGKDKIVDIKGGRDFYTNISTASELKQIKQFYNAYHQLHKEP